MAQKFSRKTGYKTIETPDILEDDRGVVLSEDGTGYNPSINKHVEFKKKNVQDRSQTGEISVESLGIEDNVADAFTKGLTKIPFEVHFPYLGVGGKLILGSVRVIRQKLRVKLKMLDLT